MPICEKIRRASCLQNDSCFSGSGHSMYCQEFGQNFPAKYFGFSRHCKRDEWFSVPRARQSWKRAIPPCPQRPPQEVWASCQRGDCTENNTLILQYSMGNVKLSITEPFKNIWRVFLPRGYPPPLGEILPLRRHKNFILKDQNLLICATYG